MSKIEKLRIMGIRSFGPDDFQELRFRPPLTLILGPNGCGKTTIIESLKYITTGEMPPGCGHGASFVHDPKLTMDATVRAKVTLRVLTAAGEKVDFSRMMEVSQKPKNLMFKSLDQTVTRVGRDGERRHASNKCIDFLQEIVSSIGVSKPILDNVIFCHQEESNWPLDENKKVKEKFDAIFNATKYIKCLEQMRKLRTEKKQEIRNMHETLLSLKDLKDAADHKRQEVSEQNLQLEQILYDENEIKEQKRPIKARIEEIEAVERNFAAVGQELGSKKSRIETLREGIAEDLRQQVHKFECGDEELRCKIDDYQTTLSLKRMQISKTERQITVAQAELKRAMMKQTEEQRFYARLEAECNHHKLIVKERDNKLVNVCKTEAIPALSAYKGLSTFTDQEAEAVHTAMSEYVVEVQVSMDKRVIVMQQSETALQSALDAARAKEAALSEELRGINTRVTVVEAQLRVAKNDLVVQKQTIKCYDSQTLIRQRLEIEKLLLDKEEALNEDAAVKGIELLEYTRDSLTVDVDNLKRVLADGAKMTAKRAELNVHEKEIAALDAKIKQLFRKNKDSFDRLLKPNFKEETLKAEIDSFMLKNAREISNAASKMEEIKKKRDSNQVIVDSLRRQLEEKQRDINSLEQRISEVCSDQPLEAALSKCRESLDAIQRESSELESTATVMMRYIEKLGIEDCCPLCHRDFASKDENVQLREELSSRVSQLPSRLDKTKDLKARTEHKYSTLLQLQPFKEQLKEAQAKLRQIQTDLIRPQTEVCKLNDELEECELNLSVLKNDAELCSSVQVDVVTMDTHVRTRVAQWNKCELLRREIDDCGVDINLEKLNDRLGELEAELKITSTRLDGERTNLMRSKDEIVKLKTKHTDLAKQEIELNQKLQAVHKIEDEIKRLESELDVERTKYAERSKFLDPTKQTVVDCLSKKDEAVAERRKFVKAESDKLDLLREKLRQLQDIHASVTSYRSSNKEAQLRCSAEALERLQGELRDLELNKASLDSELRALEKELFEQKEYERSLNTEKKIRERRREIEDLQQEVMLLEKKIDTFKESSMLSEKEDLLRKYNDLQTKFIVNQGRREEIMKRVKSLESELKLPHFRDAVFKYKKKMLQIYCTEMACEDLNKYYKALDTAIMRFHSEKMNVINKIIHHLWSSTYRGNDVDKIEIKTDETESKGADRRRSYNYRVVMHKRSAEMDMRGRCSAGQKVLASLIIRMALAETFSQNCGIFALDEPTTNLDEANIGALTDALVDIVNQRARQRNFQLIVITHDTEFVKRLARADHIREYYRVSRDGLGHSRIQKRDICEEHW